MAYIKVEFEDQDPQLVPVTTMHVIALEDGSTGIRERTWSLVGITGLELVLDRELEVVETAAAQQHEDLPETHLVQAPPPGEPEPEPEPKKKGGKK